MRQIGRTTVLGIMVVATGIAVLASETAWWDARAAAVAGVDAHVVATNIPGASAIAQIGMFLNVPPPGACANPIPSKFPTYIEPGAVLDPKRVLVGSRSNFGAPRAIGAGQEGSFLSIDPSGRTALNVPSNFARSGDQASTHNGAVRMFSANSPSWLNSINNHASEYEAIHRG
jgi:hypothetical protein